MLLVTSFTLLLFLGCVHQIAGSPVPTIGRTREIRPRPRVYKSTTSLRPQQIDDNIDINTIPLANLLDMRPRDMTNEVGAKYKDYFSRHPDVASINLNDHDITKVAKALSNLKQNIVNRGPRLRLTASIKDYLATTSLAKEENRQLILDHFNDIKFLSSQRDRVRRYREKAKEKMAPLQIDKKKRRKASDVREGLKISDSSTFIASSSKKPGSLAEKERRRMQELIIRRKAADQSRKPVSVSTILTESPPDLTTTRDNHHQVQPVSIQHEHAMQQALVPITHHGEDLVIDPDNMAEWEWLTRYLRQ